MAKIKVLLADDHPVVREGLRTMLTTTSDIEVVAEAEDGFEAVEKTKKYRPSVVLMDVRMPKVDGIESTRRIKSQLPSTSVIMMTVYDNDAYVVNAVRAGASGYLLKDASKDLLIHTIKEVNSGTTLIKTCLLHQAMQSSSSGIDNEPTEESKNHTMLDELTPREHDVLQLIVRGHKNKEIGQILYITGDTAKKHVQAILSKLGVSDRTQAAVKALQTGLVGIPHSGNTPPGKDYPKEGSTYNLVRLS